MEICIFQCRCAGPSDCSTFNYFVNLYWKSISIIKWKSMLSFLEKMKKSQQRSVKICSHFKNVCWSFKPNAFPLLQTEPYSIALYHRAIICTKIQLFNRKENELVIICSEWQQSIFDFERAQHNEFLVRLDCIIW